MIKLSGLFLLLFLATACNGSTSKDALKTGADQPEKYLPLLRDKNVGVVVNHTSMKEGQHMVDFLLAEGIEVTKIFAPEHGFRGDASAGEKIEDGVDSQTGIPVFSLYGETRKPTAAHLEGLDIVIVIFRMWGAGFLRIFPPCIW